ncbi:putative replication endonuclease from prophage-like region 1 [Serratia plymuthica A30]|uniref:replication endonuclease n=1 Tax=Serratia plymuthica TaxID=82996 RepID=UPI0002A38D6C|nr:replication endonuclease [Serratia plymuthica]EKF65043.1 putative replication endonuclease from prophage-like region 1 [Serratia plymuthica A30]
MTKAAKGRYSPTPPRPYPGGGAVASDLPFTWNAPRPAINPRQEETPTAPPQSSLAGIIALYTTERRHLAEQAEALSEATWRKYFNSDERDPELRDFNQDKRISQVKLAREMYRHNPALAAQSDLNAQPKFIRQPLQQRVDYLRREEGDDRANAFLCDIVKSELARLDAVRNRQQTIGFRHMARHEGLDALLNLPELYQDDVKGLAVKVATHMDMLFVDLYEQIVTDEENIIPDDLLQLYRLVANEAAKLCVQPPGYHALLHKGTRRAEIPFDLVPGALARLRCANWWYRNLWRLRCEWREAQLRAVCLVHKHASVYISHDALLHKREQRRKAMEFFKAHELTNEDGVTLAMEDVIEASNSNPKHRRNEMMACAKGLELLAEMRGDCAVFYTITTPSKYHATLSSGKPNPKWNHTTPRETSDYLVSLFAGIRKAMHRQGLRWYGLRVAEPHHDGTVHWHLLCFMRKKDRKAITTLMRNFAIREDRSELGPGLGKNINPRFDAELITKSKGSPTSYIAKYVSKNIDGRGLKDTISKETGKSLKETVENVTAWASLHRVQQFRFFGIPSRQAYRELRLLAGQLLRKQDPQQAKKPGTPMLADKKMDDVLAAADVGCFATYISKQGGVLIPRKYHVVRTAYTSSETPNDYGDHGTQIYGVWSPRLGDASRICTHTNDWQMVHKTASDTPNIATDTTGGDRFGFDVDHQGGPAAPWTRGNNCPLEQDTNSLGEEIATHEDPQSVNFELLGYKERRELLKRLRETSQKPLGDRRQRRPSTSGERAISPLQDELIGKLDDYAFTLGIDISRAALRRLVIGQTVNIDGERYRAGQDGVLYLVKNANEKTSSELISRFQKAFQKC